jgi:Domain of unknown function (DUF1996)
MRSLMGRGAGLLGLVVTVVLVVGAARVVVATRPDPRLPATHDFVAIAHVPRQPSAPAAEPDASTGSFISYCGRNETGHRNADNVVRSPDKPHGANHVHEYVGNVSTDAFSTDLSLAKAATTCSNGDTSTYYWPVLRVLSDRPNPADADEGAGWDGGEHNPGTRVPPARVLVQFRGNPASKVIAMPRFLRLSVGDARAATAPSSRAGTARWSCRGSMDRHTQLYPLCPPGEHLVRIYAFPSCWDGRRNDSPSHRTHVVFPAAGGVCPRDTFPIPQLRLKVAYDVPAGRSFAIDTFPEQHRSPTTDHADFINVMSESLMTRVVGCLNTGRVC